MPDEKNLPVDGFISANQDIDVQEIMDSIQKRIREKQSSGVLKQVEIDEIADMELLPLPDFLEVPNVYQPHLYPGTGQPMDPLAGYHPVAVTFEVETGTGVRGVVKKILLTIRRVIFPLIRFMTRPIYNELKDYTGQWCNNNGRDIYKITAQMEHDRKVIYQSKEYIKLMHNALNNMMVEFSKLKIDEELLKTRIKVMEDKIEFIENRERALEKKVFVENKGEETSAG